MREEKPKDWAFKKTHDPVARIEESRSLFSRIALDTVKLFKVDAASRTWALLCNDQPEEVADFIFIDAAPDQRRLEFVHVKKAGGSKAKKDRVEKHEREIAVGNYEEVVPQAIKNLRHIDLNLLEKRFDRSSGDKIGIFMVQSDGEKPVLSAETTSFLSIFADLKAQGPPLRPKVVCYSPHVQERVWDREQKKLDEKGKASRAALMLSMLLLSAQADCARVNADFEVWSEGA
jgi:hypothetical protein